MSTAVGPAGLPSGVFSEADFIQAVEDGKDSLVYFLLNVGDGDMQLVLFPQDPGDETGARRAIVVDVAMNEKLPALIDALIEADLLPEPRGYDTFPVVVGTHPHDDHIGGMPQFLEWYGEHISEYWDSGYYHTTATYVETMVTLERLRSRVTVTQPTSGMTRYIGTVKLTAITPGVGLRARYDTLGVNINDASIAIKLEFPASRIVQKGDNRAYWRPPEPWSMLLGADAQTTAWAQAAVDFPQVELKSSNEVARLAAKAIGRDWLAAHVFKVPHHASKHGVNVELVERIGPKLSLISSVSGGGRYGFPHHLAVEAIREGVEPTTSGQPRSKDHELGIYSTADQVDGTPPRQLGSIALIIPPKRGSKMSLWRFCDGARDAIDLSKALRCRRAY